MSEQCQPYDNQPGALCIVEDLLSDEDKERVKYKLEGIKKNNKYYLDKAGPNSKRYSEPRIKDLQCPDLSDHDKREMVEMIDKALKESEKKIREKERKIREKEDEIRKKEEETRKKEEEAKKKEMDDQKIAFQKTLCACKDESNKLIQPAGESTPQSDPNTTKDKKEEKSFAERWEKALKDIVINGMRGDDSVSKAKRFDAYRDMMSVCKDFREAAKAYGRIVLSEIAEDPDNQTIQTKDIGGIAGGKKYMVKKKILFKSPVRKTEKIEYPSYDAAAKVSGHELKCATNLVCTVVLGELYRKDSKGSLKEEEIQRIRDMIMVPPLMVLVEYRGYRTVAMTMLPIGNDDAKEGVKEKTTEMQKGTDVASCRSSFSTQCGDGDLRAPYKMLKPNPQVRGTTLIYGSSDANNTIKHDKEVHEQLGEICKKLNLAEHEVKAKSLESCKLWTPFDLEVHRSSDPKSSSKYIIDLSRLLPSGVHDISDISSEKKKYDYLYKLFRPELIKNFNKSINSDWTKSSIKEDKKNAGKLLNYLEGMNENILPFKFADEIAKEPYDEDSDDLIFRLHSMGINIRHLGLVYERLLKKHKESVWCCRVAAEIEARSIRKIINEKLRFSVSDRRDTEYNIAKIITDTLNAVFRDEKRIWEDINEDIHKRFVFKRGRSKIEIIQGHWAIVKKSGNEFAHTFSLRDILPAETLHRPRGIGGSNEKEVAICRPSGPVMVMKIISELLGLTWCKDVWNAFVNDRNFFSYQDQFSPQSIYEIQPRVKQMNIAYHSAGIVMEGFYNKLRDSKENDKIPYKPIYALNFMMNCYFDGLKSTPSAAATLRRYAKAANEYLEVLNEENKANAEALKMNAENYYLKRLIEKNEAKIKTVKSRLRLIYEALAKDKKDDNSLFYAAVYFDQQGETEHARKLFKEAKKLKRRGNTLLMYGDSYFDSDPEKAKELYLEGTKLKDSNHKLYGNLGVLLLKKGEIMGAWENLTTSLGKSGSKLRAIGNNCAVFCYHVLNDEKLAKKVCEHIALHDRYFELIDTQKDSDDDEDNINSEMEIEEESEDDDDNEDIDDDGDVNIDDDIDDVEDEYDDYDGNEKTEIDMGKYESPSLDLNLIN